jgi:hypothetical protein
MPTIYEDGAGQEPTPSDEEMKVLKLELASLRAKQTKREIKAQIARLKSELGE